MEKRIVIDLCCGRGGWSRAFHARGMHCIGFDTGNFGAVYPGEFRRQSIFDVDWSEFEGRCLVALASPPCDEFSRWSMPWTRARNPPLPSLSLVTACGMIARYLNVALVLENVRAAAWWLGAPVVRAGPFFLWGSGVPGNVPTFEMKKKESYGSKEKAKRAEIPYALSEFIARAYCGQ